MLPNHAESEFKLPWRETGPPNHLDDKVDPNQEVVNKEFSVSRILCLQPPNRDKRGLRGSRLRAAVQGLLEIEDTHRPRTLQKGYA